MEKVPTLENHEKRESPIIACLEDKSVKLEEILKESNGIDFANIDMGPDELEDDFAGEFKEGFWAYLMSPVNSNDKLSMKYAECTGVVVTGTDKDTGENISFLSHQNPNFFLMYKDLNFTEELNKKIQSIKDRCEPESIDAVIFGGKFADVKDFPKDHDIHKIDKDLYLESIKSISSTIDSALNFKPTVISGPKFNPVHDHVVFINKQRRLHLLRFSDNPEFVRNFNPDDIDTLSKDWKPGKWALSKLKGKE